MSFRFIQLATLSVRRRLDALVELLDDLKVLRE